MTSFRENLYFIFFLFCCFFLSCRKENTFYDIPPSNRYFYFVTNEEPNKIGLFEIPLNSVVDNDLYFKANGENLDTILQILEFRGAFFLLQSYSNKITICNTSTLSKIAEISFANKTPIGVAFPNATTAFVSFNNSSTIDVIDLTNLQIARSINVPFNSGKVIAVLFYVFVLHPSSNAVSVIDSRTFSVVRTFSMPDVPIDIETNPSYDHVYILCVGKGKIDTSTSKTSAQLVTVSLNNFENQKYYEISVGGITSTEVVPFGLSIPNKYFGFIATEKGLLRFSLTNPNQFQKVLSGIFYSVNYNNKADELIAFETKSNQTDVYFINPLAFSIKNKFLFAKNILFFLPR